MRSSPAGRRRTCGPLSRTFAGSHVVQRCGGSITWSSTLTILGISTTGGISIGFGHLEVGVAELERSLGAVLGPRLDEVELAFLELEVGAEGVEEIARHFLALVGLQLLDEAEGLLGHD